MEKRFIGALLCSVLLFHCVPDAQAQSRAWPTTPLDPATVRSLATSPNTLKNSIYADPSASPDARARDLIDKMTFEEKLMMTGGWRRFMIPGIERLGIRAVSMADGPQGLRTKCTQIKEISTSYPCMLAMSSTWNRELAEKVSSCISEECKSMGVDILLGPGMNMHRHSCGGRNFEYLGEDPFLTAEISSAYVRGLEKNGIIATAKHFICNDQEFYRHIANPVADERTLREIYLVPFEKSIKEAGLMGIMTGNNLVNGIPCCMQGPLLEKVIRREFGFKGIVMTDWQNTNYFADRQNLLLCSGQSLLMPDNGTFLGYVQKEIGKSPERKDEIETLLENMIYPTIYTLFEKGIYDREFHHPEYLEKTRSHTAAARECAQEAIILLKNSRHILPLKKGQKILLTGKEELANGGGSGSVEGYGHVSYADGLKEIFGNDVLCEKTPDDKTVRNADVVIFRISKSTGEGRDVPFGDPADEIAELRRMATLNKNIVVIINSGNGMPTDWADQVKGIVWCAFLGQERGRAMAELLAGKANFSGKLPFTIEKDWKDSVSPEYNYIGGKPSWRGNNQYKEYWCRRSNEPVEGFSEYVRPGETLDIPYNEGIFMGYRWFDKQDIPVAFAFGSGLSYTSFEYESVSIDDQFSSNGKVFVDVTVRNTGKMAGKEVIQVYVTDDESSVERPEKELKGFAKISLEPGESRTARIELDSRSFSFWDVNTHSWKMEEGTFTVKAGGSSQNLPLQKTFRIR